MIVTSDIQLFRILRDRLGDTEAESLVEFVGAKLRNNNKMNTRTFTTKEDLANAKAEIIKWMFIFSMGHLVILFACILLFIKK